MSSNNGERQALIASVESHERDLEAALGELRVAVRHQFDLGEQLGEQLSEHPLPWLIGAVLAGLWLGSR